MDIQHIELAYNHFHGDWKSGYKDEQDNYNADSVGATNLETNSNDKDGVPDNVDVNYQPQAWNSNTGILEKNANGKVETSLELTL